MSSKIESGKVSFDLKRFAGIKRDYTKDEVEKLKGTFKIEYTLSKSQSEKLWNLLNTEPYVNTLGSLSGNQAVQHAKAGLKAIYLSGWQVAADANSAGEMYPDQSLYPYDSAPKLVEAMNNALIRADQIQHLEIVEGKIDIKDKIDLVEYVSKHVTLQKSGQNFKANCPFHQEKTPSFYVFPDRGNFKCFGCSEGGDLLTYVMRRDGVEFPDALHELGREAGIDISQNLPNRAQRQQRTDTLTLLEKAKDFLHGELVNSSEASGARAYIQSLSLIHI